MKRLLTFALGILAIPLLWLASCSEAKAQTPVRWQTFQVKFNNPVFTATESGNYIIFRLEGTTASLWSKKSDFMKITVVRDTILVPPPDPKKSADYQALAATLAQIINERDDLKKRLDAQIQHDYLVSVALHKCEVERDLLKADDLLDSVIVVKIRKKKP